MGGGPIGMTAARRVHRQAQKKSGGPKTSALACRLPLFDQTIEKMPRPPFAPIPTSVFCASS